MNISLRTIFFTCLSLFVFTTVIAEAITVEISALVPGCGDNIISSGEQCDSENLGGSTCATIGFASGVLTCTSVCTFNIGQCVKGVPQTGGGGGSSGGGSGGGGGGSYTSPSNTSTTNVVFTGRAYPRSTVTLLKDAQVVATTVAGNDSNFQTTISGISTGNYLFSIYAEDKNGIRSSLFTFPISITSGVTTKVGGIYVPPSISVDKTEVKHGDNIAIFGQSSPLSDVTITINSEEEHFVKRKADENGIYLLNFDTSILEVGNHTVKSKALSDDEISSYSKAVSFVVGKNNVLTKPTDNKIVFTDVNKDGRVNLIDLSIVAFWYKKKSPLPAADINKDGIVNLVDLSILMYRWTG